MNAFTEPAKKHLGQNFLHDRSVIDKIVQAVDHGTALDLAGKGVADPSSLFAAIRTCTQLARQRRDA